MWSAGTTSKRQFIIHTEHLFPDASEATQETMPEFSLEDFESRSLLPVNGTDELITLS
jgi:hypothetical protein